MMREYSTKYQKMFRDQRDQGGSINAWEWRIEVDQDFRTPETSAPPDDREPDESQARGSQEEAEPARRRRRSRSPPREYATCQHWRWGTCTQIHSSVGGSPCKYTHSCSPYQCAPEHRHRKGEYAIPRNARPLCAAYEQGVNRLTGYRIQECHSAHMIGWEGNKRCYFRHRGNPDHEGPDPPYPDGRRFRQTWHDIPQQKSDWENKATRRDRASSWSERKW